MIRTSFRLFVFISAVSTASFAIAQNKVVIVPMAGDDVALAQEHYRYAGLAALTSPGFYTGCSSPSFNTPSQVTQVVLAAHGSARSNNGTWTLDVRVSKDFGGFVSITGSAESFSSSDGDESSNIGTHKILTLDPDSTYRFDVAMTNLTSPINFCELVMSVSYKQPEGQSILTLTPPV